MTPPPEDPTRPRDAVAHVADDLAEGRPIDWSAADRLAQGAATREQLENLKVIGQIADLHRALETQTITDDPNRVLDRSHPPPDGVGEAWGRLRLLEIVGAGSFGSVYRAWDPDLEREIAIKVLHRHVADDELRRRLLLEGRALAKLQHPNVVRVLGVESYEDRIGLCMEFVRGNTLASTVAAGHLFSPREAALVGQDVCRALAALHAAGFVHRDVTARNIMRDSSGRIVLMDFGTGLQTSQTTAAGPPNTAGTPLYMAPEVLAGQAASPCSDVYSVGVLLYYLVSGRFPIEGRTMDDLRAAHMTMRRMPLAERSPDLPASFVEAVEHATSPNPRERCPSTANLLQDLSAVLGERRTTRQHMLAVLEGVIAAVVGLTAVGAMTSRVFNHMLGRSDFVDESVRDWLSFGISATNAPAVAFVFVVLAMGVTIGAARVVFNLSASARDARSKFFAVAHRFHLDDVTTLSSCVIVVSACILLVTWWRLGSFIGSLIAIGNISTASASDLALLSPRFRADHETYRKAFAGASIACVVLWYPVLALARRKAEPLNRTLLGWGAVVLLLSIVLMDFPHRLFARSKRDFEVATWNGASCYILGHREEKTLLFCPGMPAPRNRIVRADDPNLKPTGIVRDIFTGVDALK